MVMLSGNNWFDIDSGHRDQHGRQEKSRKSLQGRPEVPDRDYEENSRHKLDQRIPG